MSSYSIGQRWLDNSLLSEQTGFLNSHTFNSISELQHGPLDQLTAIKFTYPKLTTGCVKLSEITSFPTKGENQ